jgi:hypothetical protein
MSTIVAPMLPALLSLPIGHVRVLHGLNLATMTGLVASEIALIQQAGSRTPDRALGVGFGLSGTSERAYGSGSHHLNGEVRIWLMRRPR